MTTAQTDLMQADIPTVSTQLSLAETQQTALEDVIAQLESPQQPVQQAAGVAFAARATGSSFLRSSLSPFIFEAFYGTRPTHWVGAPLVPFLESACTAAHYISSFPFQSFYHMIIDRTPLQRF